VCISYDIKKIETHMKKKTLQKRKVGKRKEPVASETASDRSLTSGAPISQGNMASIELIGSRRGVELLFIPRLGLLCICCRVEDSSPLKMLSSLPSC
jgi:hypothetical protein